MRIGIDASRAFVENPTGTERYSYEVITRLLKLPEAKKHEWVLYTKLPIFNYQFLINSLKTKILKLKVKPIGLRYLWTQIGLAWRTWRDGLDVLWVPAHTLPLLRRGFGGLGRFLRTVVTIHGIEYEWLPAYENLLQRWYLPLSTQYAVKSASRIIAVSKFTKRQLVERLGADAGKMQVIYEGVNSQTLNPKSEILNKLKIQKHKYILFVGTIQPRKNLERLIRAYLALSTKHPALKLVIAGKLGWNYEEVLEMARKHGVIVTGYIDEAERYSLLGNALVYVQPSITEGFGLPVLEAMGAGVPVVSSSGGALKEIISIQYPMSDKILFDPFDVEDMIKKIRLVIEDKELRKEMIGWGLKMKFSWDKAARETYKILIQKSKIKSQK